MPTRPGPAPDGRRPASDRAAAPRPTGREPLGPDPREAPAPAGRARPAPRMGRAAVLALQRRAGNCAVCGVLARGAPAGGARTAPETRNGTAGVGRPGPERAAPFPGRDRPEGRAVATDRPDRPLRVQAAREPAPEPPATDGGRTGGWFGGLGAVLRLGPALRRVLGGAGAAAAAVLRDPVGFLGRLVRAVGAGLRGFLANIGGHLGRGLGTWLTGTAASAGLRAPDRWDARGVLGTLAGLVGLTWESIRARIVRRGVPEPVLGAVESAAPVVGRLRTGGVVGAWEDLREQVGDLRKALFSRVGRFLVPTVLAAGVTWLLSLLVPAGAVVRAVRAVVDLVSFVLSQGEQLAAFATCVLGAVTAIAASHDGGVPGLVEGALAGAVPLLIGGLAAVLGIGGLAGRVRGAVRSLSRPVNRAVDRLVDGAVRLGRRIRARIRPRERRDPGGAPAGRTDLAGGMQHAHALLRRGLPAERIRGLLPGIRSRYGLAALDLVVERRDGPHLLAHGHGTVQRSVTQTERIPAAGTVKITIRGRTIEVNRDDLLRFVRAECRRYLEIGALRQGATTTPIRRTGEETRKGPIRHVVPPGTHGVEVAWYLRGQPQGPVGSTNYLELGPPDNVVRRKQGMWTRANQLVNMDKRIGEISLIDRVSRLAANCISLMGRIQERSPGNSRPRDQDASTTVTDPDDDLVSRSKDLARETAELTRKMVGLPTNTYEPVSRFLKKLKKHLEKTSGTQESGSKLNDIPKDRSNEPDGASREASASGKNVRTSTGMKGILDEMEESLRSLQLFDNFRIKSDSSRKSRQYAPRYSDLAGYLHVNERSKWGRKRTQKIFRDALLMFRGGSPRGADPQESAQLVTWLVFQEQHRNVKALATNPMLMDLVDRGLLKASEAVERIPMAPAGAQKSARLGDEYLDRTEAAGEGPAPPGAAAETGRTRKQHEADRAQALLSAEARVVVDWVESLPDFPVPDGNTSQARQRSFFEKLGERMREVFAVPEAPRDRT